MAVAEIEKFKSLVPLFLSNKDIWTHYDDGADVLYLHFKKPNIAYDSEQIDERTIVRYDDEGKIIGITFLHASEVVSHSQQKPKGKNVRQVKGTYTTKVKGSVIVKQSKAQRQHKNVVQKSKVQDGKVKIGRGLKG